MDSAQYTVHSVSECDIPVTVDINGVPTAVKAPGLVVELVNNMETYTRRFVPVDMDAAKTMYVTGATINVNLSAAE